MSKMFNGDPLRFEALKVGFVNKTEYLRILSQKDLRIFSGYITVQLVLAGWLSKNPISDRGREAAIFLIVLALALIVTMLIYKNNVRRGIAVEDLALLSEALKYTVPGAYLEGKVLQAVPKVRSSFGWYAGAIVVAVIAIALMIFTPAQPG